MENENKLPQFGHLPKKAISWRAIFGGLITVFAILIVLNLIGLAIGLSSIDPTEEGNAFSGIGIGAVIWWILSNIIALFVGARVAARAGVSFSTKGGIMQGFLTWALYCIFSYLVILSAVGNIISGVGNIITETATATGKAIVNQVSQDNTDGLQTGSINWQQAKAEFYSLLEDTEKKALDPDQLESQAESVVTEAEEQAKQAAKNPMTADKEVDDLFDNAEKEFANSIEAIDREALVNVMMNRSDLSREEAGKVVDNYIETYNTVVDEAGAYVESAKTEIVEQTEEAAEAVSKAAWYLSITLILGIITALFGGYTGVLALRKEYKDQVRSDY